MAPAPGVPAALAETVTLREVAAAVVVEETATLREAVVAAAEEMATRQAVVAVAGEGATGIRREAGVAAMATLPAETAGPIGVTGEFRVVARMTRVGAATTTTIRRPITWHLVRCRSRGP